MADKYLVNKELFQRELRKRGLKQKGTSKELGYDENFIARGLHEGAFPEHLIKALEREYDIKYVDYSPSGSLKESDDDIIDLLMKVIDSLNVVIKALKHEQQK